MFFVAMGTQVVAAPSSRERPSLHVGMWLLVLVIGLSILSETVYTPALPEIAQALRASAPAVEMTLTIYLFGFSIGMLFWGRLSDRFGRKPCLVAGFVLYIIGCFACRDSQSIDMLLASRLLQAFGGAAGSVVGQSIARDVFRGSALTQVYATLGMVLCLFPAIGSASGGIVCQHVGWRTSFVLLAAAGIALVGVIGVVLPETNPPALRKPSGGLDVFLRMLRDPKVLAHGFLVGAGNGTCFAYYGEGSFYLTKMLGLRTSTYGTTYFVLAAGSVVAGSICRKMIAKGASGATIMNRGLTSMGSGLVLLASLVVTNRFVTPVPSTVLAVATVVTMTFAFAGVAWVTSVSCGNALDEYGDAKGTASSFFGFGYYVVIAAVTLGMAKVHDGTLLPMPLFFLATFVLMVVVRFTALAQLTSDARGR